MKFKTFVEADEQGQAQSINAIFQKAAADIKQWLLTDIRQGLTNAIQSARGNSGMPEQLAQSIMQDLQKIAAKLRGTPAANVQRDPRLQDHFADIRRILREAEAVAPGVSQGTGASGKRLLSVDAALQDIYTKIIGKMNDLRTAVLDQMGLIKGIHSRTGQMQQGMEKGFQDVQSKVRGVMNRAGEIRNKLNQSPPMPFDAQTSKSAEHGMDELQKLKGMVGSLKLVSKDGTEISVSNRSSDWRSQVLAAGDRRFVLVASSGGKEESKPIDMGHADTIYRTAEMLKTQLGIDEKPFMPSKTTGHQVRPLKLRGGE